MLRSLRSLQGYGRLGRSACGLAPTPASTYIWAGGLATQALICRRQRRKQPERYAKWRLKLVENIGKK
jgi:hypothetical protein